MNPRSCDKIVSGTMIDGYKELNRMWLCDSAGKNSESKAISYAIKYIKRNYKNVKWIQSFADERCGLLGIVYQAANFKFCGSHESLFWNFDDEILHNSRITNGKRNKKKELEDKGFYEMATSFKLKQFRYIYFIDQREIKNLLLNIEPYPKHYL